MSPAPSQSLIVMMASVVDSKGPKFESQLGIIFFFILSSNELSALLLLHSGVDWHSNGAPSAVVGITGHGR